MYTGDMNKDDEGTLLEAANAAKRNGSFRGSWPSRRDDVSVEAFDDYDKEFIAACSPDLVLALLDRLWDAEDTVEALRECVEDE